TADETEAIGQVATRAAYTQGTTIVVETYTVSGMSHATAVGAEGMVACPATTGAYFEDHHICATLRAAKFLGVVPSGSGSGSGSGGGGNAQPGAAEGLPGCSLDAGARGAGARGWAAIAMAIVIVVRVRRHRR